MITDRLDYLDLLYRIQDPNRQDRVILLPPNEPIYEVDLNTRTINAPKFLSVQNDHNAETIYFSVDRFFDNVDLATLFCVIQYQNADPVISRGGYIYGVPFFDLVTKADENKMLFQWAIEGPATAFSGDVTFSIKFYRISELLLDNADGTGNTKALVYDFVLNTQPATSKVLYGLDINATSNNYIYNAPEIENIYQKIQEARRTELYWLVLTDNEETDTLPAREPDYPDNTINKNHNIADLIQG